MFLIVFLCFQSFSVVFLVLSGVFLCFRLFFRSFRVLSALSLTFYVIFGRFPALSGDLPAREHVNGYRSEVSQRIAHKSPKKVITEPSYAR